MFLIDLGLYVYAGDWGNSAVNPVPLDSVSNNLFCKGLTVIKVPSIVGIFNFLYSCCGCLLSFVAG